jgi:serine/threonine protein kinase
VARTYPDGQYFDRGGQRLIYRLPNEVAALKIWPTVPPEQHQRHVREVSALASLDHPSLPRIVAMLSQVDIAGQQYTFYLEQWLDAPSLTSRLADLPLARAHFNAIAQSTTDAVSALHGANIVHRDISLGNVLTRQERWFVIDLGLAKHLDMDSLTATGVRVGHTEITAATGRSIAAVESGDCVVGVGIRCAWRSR